MNRREILAAAPLLGAASPEPSSGASSIAEILQRYAAFGFKLSGGPGDRAAGEWLETELQGLRFRTERQRFSAPYYDAQTARLEVGGVMLEVLPQPPFLATPSGGVAAPLLRWPNVQPVAGALAVVVLPSRRWSTVRAPEVGAAVKAALAGGAVGVIVVTTGPTGETLALNTPIDTPPFRAPVVLLGSKAAAPLLQAVAKGEGARLTVAGVGGSREAFNLIGRIDRGAPSWLVVSTPRSGWTAAVGERGPGIAVWLALARWTARAALPVNLAFVCTSGHEYENAGGHLALRSAVPAPAKTALWVHLGANVAARDWHELGPALSPLPSPDPQRFLLTSDRLLPLARRVFAGQPGLEAPYPTSRGAEGELKEVLAAGYSEVIGVFGAHRFHHAASDDLRCVEPAHVALAANAFRSFIEQALKTG